MSCPKYSYSYHIMSCLILSRLVISIILNLTTSTIASHHSHWCMSLRSFFVGISSMISGAISCSMKKTSINPPPALASHSHQASTSLCWELNVHAEEFSILSVRLNGFMSWHTEDRPFFSINEAEAGLGKIPKNWTSDPWDVIQDFIMRKFCEHRKKDKTFVAWNYEYGICIAQTFWPLHMGRVLNEQILSHSQWGGYKQATVSGWCCARTTLAWAMIVVLPWGLAGRSSHSSQLGDNHIARDQRAKKEWCRFQMKLICAESSNLYWFNRRRGQWR